jgi:hypothetical protein
MRCLRHQRQHGRYNVDCQHGSDQAPKNKPVRFMRAAVILKVGRALGAKLKIVSGHCGPPLEEGRGSNALWTLNRRHFGRSALPHHDYSHA